MVALNEAIAFAMVRGPEAGLERLDALAKDPRLTASHRLDAVRAHLYERAGKPQLAVPLFRSAAERTTSISEKQYLITQAARLEEKIGSGTP